MAALEAQDGTAVVWDARAVHDVGQLILRYLAENPPPADSRYADDFELWGRNLMQDGVDRLTELGARPLRSVEGAS
jgi:hypothetical protein